MLALMKDRGAVRSGIEDAVCRYVLLRGQKVYTDQRVEMCWESDGNKGRSPGIVLVDSYSCPFDIRTGQD